MTECILIRLSTPPIVQHVRNLVEGDKLHVLSIRIVYFFQLHFSDIRTNIIIPEILVAIPVSVCLYASLSVLWCSSENIKIGIIALQFCLMLSFCWIHRFCIKLSWFGFRSHLYTFLNKWDHIIFTISNTNYNLPDRSSQHPFLDNLQGHNRLDFHLVHIFLF